MVIHIVAYVACYLSFEKRSVYIFAQLSTPRIFPITLYTVLLYSGRALGKTLRGDTQNALPVRRCDNDALSSVMNFERYLSLCRLMRLDL